MKQTKTVQTVVSTTNQSLQKKKKKAQQPKMRQYRDIVLSSCSQQYLMALTDAFRASAPCIPDEITLPSVKLSVKSRGLFNTGSAGYGYVTVNPYALLFNDGNAPSGLNGFNNTYPTAIASTNSGYSTSGFILQYDGLGVSAGVDFSNGPSPYSYTMFQIAGGARARLVGCTIQACYIGTELNLSGRYILTNANLGLDKMRFVGNTLRTSAGMLLDPSTRISVINSKRKAVAVSYRPTMPIQLGYNLTGDSPKLRFSSDPGSNPNNGYTDPYQYNMAILVDSIPNAPFEYEVIAHFEIIGTGALPGVATGVGTPSPSESHNDALGFSLIQNALGRIVPPDVDTAAKYLEFARKGIILGANMLTYIQGARGTQPVITYPTITEL